MTDLTKISTPFGTLPRATQMALFEAWLDEEIVEFMGKSEWHPTMHPTFWLTATYRVRPTPLTPDSINWSAVAPQFIAMARGEIFYGYVFENVPTMGADCWHVNSGDIVRAHVFASYTRGTCDWRDSLVLRPGVAK